MGVEVSQKHTRSWRTVAFSLYESVRLKASTVSRRVLLTSVLVPVFVMMSVSLYLIVHHSKDTGTVVASKRNTPAYVTTLADKIGVNTIHVSKQPLPVNFATNTDQHVSSLAKEFNATEKINVGATTVYIVTSESGTQRLFLTKNNLLILITSGGRVSNSEWTTYINAL
jgi:hypothetical protein